MRPTTRVVTGTKNKAALVVETIVGICIVIAWVTILGVALYKASR